MTVQPRVHGVCHLPPAVACPGDPCRGSEDPGVCDHVRKMAAWRAVPPVEQSEKLGAAPALVDPAVRDAVIGCPDRGPVLPISAQEDCGCLGREVSECRAGRGARPGRVTLRDCLECRAAWLGAGQGVTL